MTDCNCDRIGARFDEAYAAEKLQRYRRQGPDESTLALVEIVAAEGVEGLTLLDIGGGVGAVQHELLARGLGSVQEVEASAAYSAACRAEAEIRGHGDRITHLIGDFGSVREAVEPADIVTLDRSLCCWHEPLELLDASARMARQFYGLVFPRDTWWVRYGWRSWGNLRQIAKRSGLRLMTPRSVDVEAVLARHDLYPRRRTTSGVWQVALFAKGVWPS